MKVNFVSYVYTDATNNSSVQVMKIQMMAWNKPCVHIRKANKNGWCASFAKALHDTRNILADAHHGAFKHVKVINLTI